MRQFFVKNTTVPGYCNSIFVVLTFDPIRGCQRPAGPENWIWKDDLALSSNEALREMPRLLLLLATLYFAAGITFWSYILSLQDGAFAPKRTFKIVFTLVSFTTALFDGAFPFISFLPWVLIDLNVPARTFKEKWKIPFLQKCRSGSPLHSVLFLYNNRRPGP